MAAGGDSFRIMPSVLDRLIAKPYRGELGSVRPDGVEALLAAVQRDLESLLNTRREEQLIPLAFQHSNASVLNFGIPDIGIYSLRSSSEQARLRKAIETAVKTFEPRLANVAVALIGWDETTPVMRFRVEGMLKTGMGPEPIVFDTELHADSSKFVVRSMLR